MSRFITLLCWTMVTLGNVMAQSGSIGSISPSCEMAATGLLSTPFATCTDFVGLISVATANGSIVPAVNSWITGVCTTSPCSSAVLQNASSTIQAGCASDISSGNALALGINELSTQYPAIRDALCLEYSSNNTYCLTDVLTKYQSDSGTPVTLNTLASLMSGQFGNFLSTAPKAAYCTDCGHAIISKITPVVTNSSSSAAASVSSVVTAQCGASFADGTVPSSVKEGASSSSASSSSNNSSPVALPVGVTVAGLGLALVATLAGALAVIA